MRKTNSFYSTESMNAPDILHILSFNILLILNVYRFPVVSYRPVTPAKDNHADQPHSIHVVHPAS